MERNLTPEHYRLLALVCGYASWRNRLMTHVAVYADENYLDDGYVLMAGFVSSVDSWLGIIDPWKKILKEDPEVPYFSNHDFKSLRWCTEHGIKDSEMPLLDVKKVKLARVIASSDVLFYGYSRMWRSHFESIILNRVLALKSPKYELLRDPYYFSYIRLVGVLLTHLDRVNMVLDDPLLPLDVFVDENGKLAEEASKLFLAMKEISDPHRKAMMGVSAPLDDKITVPLQCADLLVGQLREYYVSNTVTDSMEILMQRRFKPPFSNVGLDWTKEKLQQLADGLVGLPEKHWLR